MQVSQTLSRNYLLDHIYRENHNHCTRHQSKDTDVDELTALLTQSLLALARADKADVLPNFQSVPAAGVQGAIKEWLEMEDNPEVVLIELENKADSVEESKELAAKAAAEGNSN